MGALVAAGTLVRTWLNLRTQLRPIVVAELQKHAFLKWTQEVVVRNYGQSPARELTVTFEPPLVDPDPKSDEAATMTAATVRRFAKVISVLAPGAELRQIYYAGDVAPGSNKVKNSEPNPDTVKVTVKYRGEGKRKKYTDTFELDVHLIGLSTTGNSRDNPASQRRVVAEGVAALAKIQNWP